MRAFIKNGKADFSGDGYYVIRPDMTSIDQIEWVDCDKSLEFSGPGGLYEIIGNGCDMIERVQWAEQGFTVVADKTALVGWRAEANGGLNVVDVWADEEGMGRQEPNMLATAIAQRLGYQDVSHGLWGTLVVVCGKAEVK